MDCYDRDEEAKALWRHFKAGRNVLMLAPRRTGKTVLLDRLKTESDGQGYHAIVLDVEGFTEEKAFFRELCASIQEEIGFGRSLLASLSGRLKQVVRGTETAAEDWRNLLLQVEWPIFAEHLLAELEVQAKDNRGWLILVDEITIFVSALLNRHNKERASDFLYTLRRLVRAHPRVRWLLTGSIGLDTVARRHGFEGSLVDLEIFQLEPFTQATAAAFLRQVAEDNGCTIADEVIETILDRLGWLSPYYLSKLAEAACEKTRSGPVEQLHVVEAVAELLGVARRTYWSTWREHLDKNFIEPERSRLFRILAILCSVSRGTSFDTLLLSLNPGGGREVGDGDLRDALDILEADGYLTVERIDQDSIHFRFRMNLLREWWARYVATPLKSE